MALARLLGTQQAVVASLVPLRSGSYPAGRVRSPTDQTGPRGVGA